MQKWALFLIKVFCQEYLLKTFLQNNCLLNKKIIIFIELRTIIATCKPIRMLIFYCLDSEDSSKTFFAFLYLRVIRFLSGIHSKRTFPNIIFYLQLFLKTIASKNYCRKIPASMKNTFLTEIIKSFRKMTEYDHFDFERVKTRMKTIDCWAVCHLFSFLIRKFILYLGLTLGIE